MRSRSARVRKIAEVRPVLDGIDWDFGRRLQSRDSNLFDARRHHWYPATFIPELPFTLVEVLSENGARVFDPFSGVGTSLFQAASLAREPIGTEICHVSAEISRSLWSLISSYKEDSQLALAVEQMVRAYSARKDYPGLLSDSSIPVEELRRWYSQSSFNEVAFLIVSSERQEQAEPLRAATRIALSATLKAASAQSRGWGCVADNVRPTSEQRSKERSALGRFVRNVTILERDVARFRKNLSSSARRVFEARKAEEVILNADVCSQDGAPKIGDESIDLVVTSPPYPEMTDYCLSQRLSYYWLGEEPEADLAGEIGARRKRSSSKSLVQYRSRMADVGREVFRLLKPGGLVCLITPKFEDGKRNHRERLKTVEDIFEDLASTGFRTEHRLLRKLPEKRRHHNQKWVSIAEEEILILTK